MVKGFDFSSDARYVRVSLMEHPFSYIVPVNNFGNVEEIWDTQGNVLTELKRTPINTGLPDPDRPRPGSPQFGQEDQEGRRQVKWRIDGQGITYLEQEPGRDDAEEEDPEQERLNPRMDRVMQWLPPFDDTSLSVVYESDNRISAHRFFT